MWFTAATLRSESLPSRSYPPQGALPGRSPIPYIRSLHPRQEIVVAHSFNGSLRMPNDVISGAERHRRLLAVLATVVGVATSAGTAALVVLIARAYGAADATWAAAWFIPPIIGAVAAARRPSNSVGWVLLLIAFVGTASQAAYGFEPSPPLTIPEAVLIGVGTSLLYLALVGVAVLIVIFPTGRPPSGPRRHIVQFAVVWYLVIATGVVLSPRIGGDARSYSNPLQITALNGFMKAMVTAGTLLAIALFVLVAGEAIPRRRRAHGIERQQFKWVTYAATLGAPATIIAVSPAGNYWWGGNPGGGGDQRPGRQHRACDCSLPALRHRPDRIPHRVLPSRGGTAVRRLRGLRAAHDYCASASGKHQRGHRRIDSGRAVRSPAQQGKSPGRQALQPLALQRPVGGELLCSSPG